METTAIMMVTLAILTILAAGTAIILAAKLRTARRYTYHLKQQLNDASYNITRVKSERNQAVLQRDELQRTLTELKLRDIPAPIHLTVDGAVDAGALAERFNNPTPAPRQTFSPRPEPSRARPGVPATPAIIVTDYGTTYNGPSPSCDTSPSSTDSGSCGGGGE